MKHALMIFAAMIGISAAANGANAATDSVDGGANAPALACKDSLDVLKKLKVLKDAGELSVIRNDYSCTAPGARCSSSSDCCGASMCHDSYCSDPGVGGVGPGGHCESSSDCAGASMCHDGFCSDPGIGGVGPGGHCESSSDCAGASMCHDGWCSDPGIGNIQPGGHCESSSDCAGASMCRDGFCN